MVSDYLHDCSVLLLYVLFSVFHLDKKYKQKKKKKKKKNFFTPPPSMFTQKL